MVKIYIKKIISGAINQETGLPWTIEDVPERWREEVREALENQKNLRELLTSNIVNKKKGKHYILW